MRRFYEGNDNKGYQEVVNGRFEDWPEVHRN